MLRHLDQSLHVRLYGKQPVDTFSEQQPCMRASCDGRTADSLYKFQVSLCVALSRRLNGEFFVGGGRENDRLALLEETAALQPLQDAGQT